MINPVQMLMRQFGNTPQQMINGIFNQNPQFAKQIQGNDIYNNAMQMYKSGNKQGLEQLVRNVYQNRGIDINQMLNGMGRR